MAHPMRIQRKRVAGWKMPVGAVYVGRPSKWGNPFDSAEEYRKYILCGDGPSVDDVRRELQGTQLACWCSLDKACHADVLAEIANEGSQGVVMPWDKRAVELESVEGHYCHYVAWKEWFASWNARQSSALELDIDELDTVALYAAFCAACSETKGKP